MGIAAESAPQAIAPASGASSLPGVRIEFPPQRVRFSRAELVRGITLRWVLVVDPGIEGTVEPDLVPNGCGKPGVTGFVTHAVLRNSKERFCRCDVGLCPPRSVRLPIRPGRDAGTLVFHGRAGDGPSDTGATPGPPFERGPAELEVTSSGRIDGRPFHVIAKLQVVIEP